MLLGSGVMVDPDMQAAGVMVVPVANVVFVLEAFGVTGLMIGRRVDPALQIVMN
jgi:hypothetical protein